MIPFRMGTISYRSGAKLYCFTVRGSDEPGVGSKVLEILAKMGANAIWTHMELLDEGTYYALIIADMSSATASPEEVARRIEEEEDVKATVVSPSLFENAATPCWWFPVIVGDERAIIVRETVVEKMGENMERMFGSSAWAALLYHSGHEFGRAAYRDHVGRLAHGVVKPNAIIELAELLGSSFGFGLIKIIYMDLEAKRFIVRVEKMFECELAGKRGIKGKTSHFFRGVVAGWLSEYAGEDIFCEEVMCINMGDPHCEFDCCPVDRIKGVASGSLHGMRDPPRSKPKYPDPSSYRVRANHERHPTSIKDLFSADNRG